MPSAPCKRSRRASSRSEVWSSHFPYAASSEALPGCVRWRLANSASAHGLMVSPPTCRLPSAATPGRRLTGRSRRSHRQAGAHRRRQELGGLELLDDGQRLRLAARPRLIVRREGQEDDEAREDREAAGQDAEHAGGAVAVGEVAALRRPPPDEEHRRDSRGVDGDDDDDGPQEAHGARATYARAPIPRHPPMR